VYDFSSQAAYFQVVEARFSPEKAILGEKRASDWPKIVHKFDFVANFDVFFIKLGLSALCFAPSSRQGDGLSHHSLPHPGLTRTECLP